jgi:hypothetical protein
LLTDYALEPVQVHAVFPAGPRPSTKVRVFADYLAGALGGASSSLLERGRRDYNTVT